jgi:hypothetical protein
MERAFRFGGRTSVLSTTEPVRVLTTKDSLAAARKLLAVSRLAEAYEMLTRMFEDGIDSEAAARECTWICEAWGRDGEAIRLRAYYSASASEQLDLFG